MMTKALGLNVGFYGYDPNGASVSALPAGNAHPETNLCYGLLEDVAPRVLAAVGDAADGGGRRQREQREPRRHARRRRARRRRPRRRRGDGDGDATATAAAATNPRSTPRR